MKILYEVDTEDGFICEVFRCGADANYFVTDWDGEEGYICKKCNDEVEKSNGLTVTEQIMKAVSLEVGGPHSSTVYTADEVIMLVEKVLEKELTHNNI